MTLFRKMDPNKDGNLDTYVYLNSIRLYYELLHVCRLTGYYNIFTSENTVDLSTHLSPLR